MNRLCFLIVGVALCTGCMSYDSAPSVSPSSEDSQTRHYRPVHPAHPEWSIGELGRSLTIYADDIRVKVSARRPESVVLRQNGLISGRIVRVEHGARFDGPNALEFQCITRDSAHIVTDGVTIPIRRTQAGLSTPRLEIRKLADKRRYSLTEHIDAESCEGHELELPFSTLGALIFSIDDLPLAQRAGLAWYVTRFPVACE